MPADPATLPAFPPSGRDGGMTLRDYFAAAALTGLLAGEDRADPDSYPKSARTAYAQADAMLRIRATTADTPT